MKIKLEGTDYYLQVHDYDPGSRRAVTSRSIDPQDPEELEYTVYLDMNMTQPSKIYNQPRYHSMVLKAWKDARYADEHDL